MGSSKKINLSSKDREENRKHADAKKEYSKPSLSIWGKVVDTRATVGSDTSGGAT